MLYIISVGLKGKIVLQIFVSRWFERYARKNDINNKMLLDAVGRAENGLIDADLGRGVIKQRVARAGQGKSKGYRTIIIIHYGEKAFFGYPVEEPPKVFVLS